MERCRRDPRGKILSLLQLRDEHPEAFDATLIQAGLRWRDVESSSPRRRAHAWADINAVIATRAWDSPLSRQTDQWWWGDPKHDVLVSTLEMTAAVNVKTPAPKGVKKSDFVRVPRPWDKRNDKKAKRIGTTAMPLAELDAWLEGDFTPVNDEKHGGKRELTAA